MPEDQHMRIVPLVAAVVSLASSSLLATDALPMRVDRTIAIPRSATAAPPLRAADATTRARVVLSTAGATTSDLVALRRANTTGDAPLHLGVVREVNALTIGGGVAAAQQQRWQWRGAVHAEGARRIRLRLENLTMPLGTRLWIYPNEGPAVAIDRALAHDGVLWTPSVPGDTATIEIDAPSTATLRITAIADVRSPAEVAPQGTECIEDASCHTGILDPRFGRAIAFYEFVAGTHLLGCTGGLLDNANGDNTPLFLTANHCVKNEVHAATVETMWDYRSSTCNGPAPSLDELQRYPGATLLVTSAASDVTLLRLPTIPAGRTFLGWDTRPAAAGTIVFHLSHPNAAPLRYSASMVDTTFAGCATSPRPNFLYTRPLVGATDIGSSGAPAITRSGQVIGQLKSACGPESDNACNRANYDVDGAFAASFAVLEPFLNPQPTPCSICSPDATTACLLGNRFKVTTAWTDPTWGAGAGKVIRPAGAPQLHPVYGAIGDSAFFSFYDFLPDSVETTVKMTKGVSINDHYWIFVAGFAGSPYSVRVEDTRTCATWERSSPKDATEVLRDYEAFPLP
jgi:hypothetical protein